MDPIEAAFVAARGALAANLRAFRGVRALTQEQTAERAGVSAIYYQALERGGSECPSLRTISRLALALDVTPDRLLIPAEPPPPRAPGRPKNVDKTPKSDRAVGTRTSRANR